MGYKSDDGDKDIRDPNRRPKPTAGKIKVAAEEFRFRVKDFRIVYLIPCRMVMIENDLIHYIELPQYIVHLNIQIHNILNMGSGPLHKYKRYGITYVLIWYD